MLAELPVKSGLRSYDGLQKKAALEVFNGYFQRIAEGRRDYDLITEEVLC